MTRSLGLKIYRCDCVNGGQCGLLRLLRFVIFTFSVFFYLLCATVVVVVVVGE